MATVLEVVQPSTAVMGSSGCRPPRRDIPVPDTSHEAVLLRRWRWLSVLPGLLIRLGVGSRAKEEVEPTGVCGVHGDEA